MQSRDALVAAVHVRLARFAKDRDADAVLSKEALADVAALQATLSDPAGDVEAVHAAGWLYWFRYLALPQDEGQEDLSEAVKLLAPVYERQPGAVPDPIRAYLDSASHGKSNPEAMANRAAHLLRQTLAVDDPGALNEAIDLLQRVLARIPDDDPDRGHYLSSLDGALQRRFERTGVLTDLEQAVKVSREAVAATPPGHRNRLAVLSNLGNALGTRFEQTGMMPDLDEAVELSREATGLVPPGHPDRSSILGNFAANLLTRSMHADGDDLNHAVDVFREAVTETPPRHPNRHSHLSALGASLMTRYERTGALPDLDEAIDVLRKAVQDTPQGHPRLGGSLSTLGNALGKRFERTGRSSDQDEAVEILRRAVTVTHSRHPNRAAALSSLGNALLARYERTGDLADLNAAVDSFQQAVATAVTGQRDGAYFNYQGDLGDAQRRRFERTGALADLNQAVESIREAAACPPNRSDYAAGLSNLGGILQTRFMRTGSLEDLEQAIAAYRHAVAAAGGHPDRGAMLSGLCISLVARYQRRGDTADLDEAVEVGRQAVVAGRADESRYMHHTNLGNALRRRYERTGSQADLDDSIDNLRQAVTATPPGSPDKAETLSNLGGILTRRFERTGTLADIDESVEAGRLALEATPQDRPKRSIHLANLGIGLLTRFERTGNQADLDQAVELDRQALAATPPDHPDRARRWSSLGNALQARATNGGTPRDLDEAVEAGRQALAATPPDHPDRTRYQANLAISLWTRAVLAGTEADLDQAIALNSQVIAATPGDHPYRAAFSVNLSTILEARFDRAQSADDLNSAIKVSRAAAAITTAPPNVRVRAARQWGNLAARAGHWAEAADAYAVAVGLLALVAPRNLHRSDQEYWLAELAGLGTEAAACCLQAGQIDRAVELWEQGRGVLYAQALDTRTDVDQLAEQHPELAAEFVRLRAELDSMSTSEVATAPALASITRQLRGERVIAIASYEIDQRRQLADDFERVVTDIRAQPGFDRFLLPLPAAELAAAAAHGPVVLLNVSDIRSDAILLTSEGVQLVPLRELTQANVANQVDTFMTALAEVPHPASTPDTAAHAERQLFGVLSWLWDVLAAPVLGRLRITSPPVADADKQWPRLWWCPSGPLAFLPLHAAGYHASRFDSEPQTVLDRVISSYTPTIRALIHARRPVPALPAEAAGQAIPTGARQLVVVAMPHTPDQGDLPGAVDEAVLLRDLFRDQVIILRGDLLPEEASRLHPVASPDGERADFDTVRGVLPRFRWAHFACHASSDPANPSISHLLLQDHQTHPLTVVALTPLRLEHAELAFLSACATARTGARLADEAIHLGAAFQLAGYRHVIATLWPIGDRSAVEIAAGFYTALARRGDPARVGAAARIIHDAARRQRDSLGARRPWRWAAHVHSGP